MKKLKCSICDKKFQFDEGDECAYTMQSPRTYENIEYYENVCESCQEELHRTFMLKLIEMEKKYNPELKKMEKAYNTIKHSEYGPGTVVVITKDNNEYIGSLLSWKPEENYFTIISGLVVIEINFENIKSAIEYGARVSINSPIEGETDDLLERARKDLKIGRKNNWFKKEIPIRDWEKE